MMLAEEGRLSLDDSIRKYFPDAPDNWQRITLRHLLTHTVGTSDYPQGFDFRREYTEAELLKRIEAVPLAFAPGDRRSYSNRGLVVLGMVIHKVSGEFYRDFLHHRIFTPLGMATARIIGEADIVPNRAAGYVLVKGDLKNQEWVDKLLKKSSLEQMWTPVTLTSGQTTDYGLGCALGEIRGHHIIEHGGAWQGFKSYIARYVDDKLTVVVFANLAQAEPADIAHGVVAIYNPDLEAPPPKANLQ